MNAPDPLLDFRREFPILERCTYMVSNSLGAMPRTVPERLAEYADQWATHGVRAWAKGWWSMPLALGDEIAPLIGAGPGEVAMVPTVSMAQAAILSALDFRNGRDTIVMTALDFPSVRYVFDTGAGPSHGQRLAFIASALLGMGMTMAMVGALMLFSTYNDLARLIRRLTGALPPLPVRLIRSRAAS